MPERPAVTTSVTARRKVVNFHCFPLEAREVWRLPIGASARLVLACALSHANARAECRLFVATIAREIHRCARTVRAALRELERAELVASTRTGGPLLLKILLVEGVDRQLLPLRSATVAAPIDAHHSSEQKRSHSDGAAPDPVVDRVCAEVEIPSSACRRAVADKLAAGCSPRELVEVAALARAAPWRKAPMGAWIFASDAFAVWLEQVRKESRRVESVDAEARAHANAWARREREAAVNVPGWKPPACPL
jgi:hypothetical protein